MLFFAKFISKKEGFLSRWYILFFAYFMQIAICGLYITYFIALVKILTVRISCVTDLFEKFQKNKRNFNKKDFGAIFVLYKRCMDIFKLINNTFGKFLLVYVAFLFYSLTNKIYITTVLMYWRKVSKSSTCWVFFIIWMLSELCGRCEQFKIQVCLFFPVCYFYYYYNPF